MEGSLFETILLYFCIIPAAGAFIIMLLREKPKVGIWLTPVIAMLVLFAFMFYLEANAENDCGVLDTGPDITVMISALTSFCILAITFCIQKLSSDQSSRNSVFPAKDRNKFPGCREG
ncbi:MAG: hypothetical protein PHV82_11160 [Victivallaceae bacterium]|nr:hypothetical protein [Victivallaceae bacterium]